MGIHAASVETKSEIIDRLKAWTICSFISGTIALLFALIAHSDFLQRQPNSSRLDDPSLFSFVDSWDETLYDVLRRELEFQRLGCIDACNIDEHISSSYTNQNFDLQATTRYHFDFALIGDTGQFLQNERQSFFWITSHIINDLQVLHNGAVVQISASRREISFPFGTMPYCRTSDISESVKNINDDVMPNNRIHYILDSDMKLGKTPIVDIIDDHSDISSECARDSGCTYIQMLFYVPPINLQPLHITSSLPSLLSLYSDESSCRESAGTSQDFFSFNCMAKQGFVTGLSVAGKTSVVVANLGTSDVPDEQYIKSLLNLSRYHTKELLGFPPVMTKFPQPCSSSSSSSCLNEQGGMTSSDILFLRAIHLRSIFPSTLSQLAAFRNLYYRDISYQTPFLVDKESDEKYNRAVDLMVACRQMMQANSAAIASISNTSHNPDIAAYRTHTPLHPLEEMHALLVAADILCRDLFNAPNLLPHASFPLDMQLVTYAPYWIPIAIPLIKGLLSLVIVLKKKK